MSARRKFAGPPNRYKGPQYSRIVVRLNFERGAKSQFPNLRGAKIKGGHEYIATVPVPHYEARKVHIRFGGMSDVPSVFADGSRDSPHRYSDGSLCMWHPRDPIDHRWVFGDGLLALIWFSHRSPVQRSLVARDGRVAWRRSPARVTTQGAVKRDGGTATQPALACGHSSHYCSRVNLSIRSQQLVER